MSNNLTFEEKTFGNWHKIFNEFVADTNLHLALINPGKSRAPSPFDARSKKDGFRFHQDFERKGGLGFCNSQGAMSGVGMIAFLNASTTKAVASQIHKFLDGKTIDIIKTRTDIERVRNKQKNQDLHKLDFSRKLISNILKQPINNKFRDDYLKSRGLEKAIPMLNNDIRSIPNLYYNKTTNLPAMVSVVRNEDNKIAFLHKVYLDDKGNKATIDAPKQVTYHTRSDAYQRPFLAQVNNPTKNNSKVEHVAEGIETALAVVLITKNKDRVVSSINSHGMTMFEPKSNTRQVHIWADHDKAGIEAAQKLQAKLLSTGKVKVQVVMPRQQGHDFLDELTVQQKNPNQNKNIQFNHKDNKAKQFNHQDNKAKQFNHQEKGASR
jgi:hypothetical protein